MRKIEKQNNNENSMISENKNNIINDMNESLYNNNAPYNSSKKIDINNLEQCFRIDLQLINDFYDFELSEQKEIMMRLIDVNQIIYSLKFQNISNLALRTQMLRYVRKMLIEMDYNLDENEIYINSIINNEDNLSILKINPLINNYKYPTKLFSYLNDFWSLSMKTRFHQDLNRINKGRLSELFINKNTEEKEEKEDSSSSPSEIEETKKEIEKNEQKRDLNIKEKNSKGKGVNPDEDLEYMQMKTANFNKRESTFNINQNDKIKFFDINIYELLLDELNNVPEIIRDINISSTEKMKELGNIFSMGY